MTLVAQDLEAISGIVGRLLVDERQHTEKMVRRVAAEVAKEVVVKEIDDLAIVISASFDEVQERFEAIDERFDQIDVQLDDIHGQLGGLHRDMAALQF